jgi:hypothetical protein
VLKNLRVYEEVGQEELKNGLIAIAKICENNPNANSLDVINAILQKISRNMTTNINSVDASADQTLYAQLTTGDDRATVLTALNRIAPPKGNLEEKNLFMQNLGRVLQVEEEL